MVEVFIRGFIFRISFRITIKLGRRNKLLLRYFYLKILAIKLLLLGLEIQLSDRGGPGLELPPWKERLLQKTGHERLVQPCNVY